MFHNTHIKHRPETDDSALSDVEGHRFQGGRALPADEDTEGHAIRKPGLR